MTYVEWLRVGVTLKRTAITLGILIVVAIAARVWLSYYGPLDAVSFAGGLQRDPSSHVTTSTLPDGSSRTVIDNPAKKVHVVVTDAGQGHETVDITMMQAHGRPYIAAFDGKTTKRTTNGKDTEIVVQTDEGHNNNFALEFGVAGFIALIAGMILAGTFARENDGHLEIALTKPISRTALAVRVMLVDGAGIVGVWVLGVIAMSAIHTIFFGPHFAVTGRDWLLAAVVLLGAFAWYAAMCAATASLRRSYGLILGTAWIAGELIPLLARIDDSAPPFFILLRTIAKPLSWIDPFTYSRVRIMPVSTSDMMRTFPYSVEIPVLVGLIVAYAIIAIAQWRRVEA